MTCEVPELEIVETEPLGAAEGAFVEDNHSLLNVIHVLDAELQLLGLSLEGKAGSAARSRWIARRNVAASLKDRNRTLAAVAAMGLRRGGDSRGGGGPVEPVSDAAS